MTVTNHHETQRYFALAEDLVSLGIAAEVTKKSEDLFGGYEAVELRQPGYGVHPLGFYVRRSNQGEQDILMYDFGLLGQLLIPYGRTVWEEVMLSTHDRLRGLAGEYGFSTRFVLSLTHNGHVDLVAVERDGVLEEEVFYRV